jgi:hypothetical protein
MWRRSNGKHRLRAGWTSGLNERLSGLARTNEVHALMCVLFLAYTSESQHVVHWMLVYWSATRWGTSLPKRRSQPMWCEQSAHSMARGNPPKRECGGAT